MIEALLAAIGKLVSLALSSDSSDEQYQDALASVNRELKALRQAPDEYDAADQAELDASVPPTE